jgi:lantibiotic modifying enzyme
MNRRQLGALGLFFLLFQISGWANNSQGLTDSIQRIHLWLSKHKLETTEGTAWVVAPADTGMARSSLDLYSGSPGVVLFYLEAHHALGKAEYLEEAKAGANYLLAKMPTQLFDLDRSGAAGLYSGLSGIAFTLREAYKATKDERYNQAFERALKLLINNAETRGEITHWGMVTDIISGNAGIGLFLLYAYRETKNFTWLELAANVGNWLSLQSVRVTAEQWKWRMWPGFERTMPNFSHGTAGVAFFQAELFKILEEGRYLRPALNGARYLQAIKKPDGLICHHEEGEGKDLFYLGYCHGPVGTARLYYTLYTSYKKQRKIWQKAWDEAIAATMNTSIPQQRTSGFWNNVSQCCGNAGVAEFYLTVFKMSKKKKYREYAWLHTQDLLKRATADAKGLRWVQAENRSQPDNLQTQSGYMQGAAGIGILLCHWIELEKGQQQLIRFPDDPFRGI